MEFVCEDPILESRAKFHAQKVQVGFGIDNIYMNYNTFMAHPLLLF